MKSAMFFASPTLAIRSILYARNSLPWFYPTRIVMEIDCFADLYHQNDLNGSWSTPRSLRSPDMVERRITFRHLQYFFWKSPSDKAWSFTGVRQRRRLDGRCEEAKMAQIMRHRLEHFPTE
jgi:hypothetical protein